MYAQTHISQNGLTWLSELHQLVGTMIHIYIIHLILLDQHRLHLTYSNKFLQTSLFNKKITKCQYSGAQISFFIRVFFFMTAKKHNEFKYAILWLCMQPLLSVSSHPFLFSFKELLNFFNLSLICLTFGL